MELVRETIISLHASVDQAWKTDDSWNLEEFLDTLTPAYKRGKEDLHKKARCTALRQWMEQPISWEDFSTREAEETLSSTDWKQIRDRSGLWQKKKHPSKEKKAHF